MSRNFTSNKLGIRNWLTFIIAGLVGQFAWTIENMYLNRYLFALTGSTELIDVMVAASAIAATLTTLLMGALCDRIGKRKPFIFFMAIKNDTQIFLQNQNWKYLQNNTILPL